MTDRFQAYIDNNNCLYITTLEGNQFNRTITSFTDNPKNLSSELVKGIICWSVQLHAASIQETNDKSNWRSRSNNTHSEAAIEDQ